MNLSSKALSEKFLLLLFLFLALFSLVSYYYVLPAVKDYNYRKFLQSIESKSTFKSSTFAFEAKYEDGEESLFGVNQHTPVHPGSNFKLFTSAVALKELGAGYTFNTFLYLNGNNVTLVGGGDPTLKLDDLSAFVEAVKAQNLASVNLYFDDSFFKGEIYGPNWDSALFEEYYAVPITGLGIDNNILKFFGLIDEGTNVFTIEALPLEKFGSILDKRVLKSSSADLVNPMTAVWVSGKGVTLTGDTLKDLAFFTNAVVKEPGDFAARLLAQELDKAGIKVLSVGRATNPLLYGELLYQHDSAPLSKVIFDMLKFSQNHYAEAIIRALGENAGPSSNSQKAGVAVLNQFLDEIGVPQGEVLAFDGSGISPDTRATSNSILMLFDYINQQDWAQSFWDSLPEAGVDGTLRGRFGDIDDDIHLMAKTGTHVGANSLSGKIDRKNGKSILFSIHVFGHVYSVQEATKFVVPVIDDVVSFLDKQY